MIDFLEVLRSLNKDNINNDPKLRDAFFQSLIICDEAAPDYLSVLSDAYHEEFRKEYEGNIIINYRLSEIFGNEITRQLTDKTIEDNENCLYIPARNSADAVTYVGSVKGMKKLVEIEPQHFDFFKERLLMGLITRYCKDAARSENIPERLNKLVGIYAEHIRHLEIYKDVPMIIDEKFIDDVKKLPSIDCKGCWRVIHDLIARAMPIKREKYFDKETFINEPFRGTNRKR